MSHHSVVCKQRSYLEAIQADKLYLSKEQQIILDLGRYNEELSLVYRAMNDPAVADEITKRLRPFLPDYR